MITFKNFQFASAPGTPVHWFCQAANFAGLGVGWHSDAYKPFVCEFDPFGHVKPALFRVSLVMHPASYLWTLYRYAFPKPSPLDKLGRFLDFDEFLCEYLGRMPGEASRIMLGYKADSFMRAEDLPHAFVEFARSLNVPEESLRKNFFNRGPDYVQLDQSVGYWRKKLLKSEREFCEQFDYF